MTTMREYWDYKNRVEAKTTGANIHKVSGLLGRCLNSVARLDRDGARLPEERLPDWQEWEKKDKAWIEQATKEIAAITGVHP